MQLGKKRETSDFMEAMKSEEGLEGLDEPSPSQSVGRGPAQAPVPVTTEGLSFFFFFFFFCLLKRSDGFFLL